MNTRSNELPLPERPSVKMAYYGPKALSNAELLSLVLGSGTKSSLELADSVISYTTENIGSLGLAEVCELSEIYGVGNAKACAIAAAMELGRREASLAANGYNKSITDSGIVADLMRAKYAVPGETREHFVMYCLNSKLRLISEHVISIGSIDSAPVHPREVFAPAIKKGAAAIVVAHNHPSGDPTPSQPDIDVTRRLKEASAILGIKLQDHVIVGSYADVSMRQEGYLD